VQPYVNNQKLNKQLYKAHLQCATAWPNSWQIIQPSIDEKLQLETEEHYQNLNKKLDNIQKKNKHKAPHKNRYNPGEQQFHPRTVNLTSINFTKEEKHLLNLDLQHSTEKPLKTYWTNLIIETEQAIKLLDVELQNPFRILATKKLKQILHSGNQNTTAQKRQLYVIRSINNKLSMENTMIVRADKGKTTVIINKDEYTKKVHNFLTENSFHNLPQDPTNRDHKHLLKVLQQSNLVIDKKQIKHITQKEPQPPTLKAQIK
jgi:hypothetical protein